MEPVVIRLATSADVDAINLLYKSAYGKIRSNEQFEWEFNTSPAGRAIYVVAVAGDRVVGTQCVIPYFLTNAAGQRFLSGKSEDTLVSSEFRGRDIFSRMYALLINECKAAGIQVIWGFTYATSPFKKLGFSVPFAASMGLLVNSPTKTYSYLNGLSKNRSPIEKVKIAGLCLYSFIRQRARRPITVQKLQIRDDVQALNHETFNYINEPGEFGILADKEFIRYRIVDNPYSQKHFFFSLYEEGQLKLSLIVNRNSSGIAYILNLYAHVSVSSIKFRQFLASVMAHRSMKGVTVYRIWEFDTSVQNKQQLGLFKSAGFTFIKRGISFVWMPLAGNCELDPKKMVLSRLVSQGTD